MQTEPHIPARGRGCRSWLLQQHESVGLCVRASVCLPNQKWAVCDELPVICGVCGEVGFEGTVAG